MSTDELASVEIALATPLNFNYSLRTARLARELNLAARRRHKDLRKWIKNMEFSHSFEFCDDTDDTIVIFVIDRKSMRVVGVGDSDALRG